MPGRLGAEGNQLTLQSWQGIQEQSGQAHGDMMRDSAVLWGDGQHIPVAVRRQGPAGEDSPS